MGRIVVKLTVANASAPSKKRIFDALVDTGASMLILPKAWKRDFGKFKETRKTLAQLANQRTEEVEVCGPVSIEIEGFPRIYNEVIFLDMEPSEGSYEPLLGYIPLEQAGVVIDMLGHRLKSVKYMDLK